ncbi:hypothetical protein Trydic_g9806 [Trypoxylus dichotomus]
MTEILSGNQIQEDERQTFEDTYYDVLSLAKALLNANRNVSVTPSQRLDRISNLSTNCGYTVDVSNVSNIQGHVKLPNISSPDFSGYFSQWDTPMICTLTSKLDLVSKSEWEQLIAEDGIESITVKKLTDFLPRRCQLLETIDNKTKVFTKPIDNSHEKRIAHTGQNSKDLQIVKFLKNVIGQAHLTYGSLYTVLTQIVAVLNSRPLLPLTNDPEDYSFLTLSHFLIGDTLMNVRESDVRDILTNRLKLYEHLQKIIQHFWKRWSFEYLTSLQQRSKWTKSHPNLAIGDLVIIKDDNLRKSCWNVGRIASLHPGDDGVGRVVSVLVRGEAKTIETGNIVVKAKVFKIGVWNIRSLSGKELELSQECDKAGLDLLVIPETKKKGTGITSIGSEHMLIWNGVIKEEKASAGKGCLLNRKHMNYLDKWEAVTERILTVELKYNMHTMTIIAIYGPNEDEKVDKKDKVWKDFSMTIESAKGIIYIAGDFNCTTIF